MPRIAKKIAVLGAAIGIFLGSASIALAVAYSIAVGGTNNTAAPTTNALIFFNGTRYTSAVATSTATNGINISAGCFAVGGVCVGGGGGAGTVTQVNTTDGSLTGGPITTTGTLSINPAHSNWFTALQNFTNASTSKLTATSTVWLATGGGTVNIGTTTGSGEILSLDNTQNSNYTTLSFLNSGVNGILDTDSVDSFNGITGYTYLGSKSNHPLVLGYNNQGQCGIYSDNGLDTLFDCYPPANGKEMTYTNSLVQPNGTVFRDNYLMNYDNSTGLISGFITGTSKYAQPFPIVVDGWWEQQNGNTSEATTSWNYFAIGAVATGTNATTSVIAMGDVGTTSASRADGVDTTGATIQITSSSSRTTALEISKNTRNSLTRLLTVNNSGNIGIGLTSPSFPLDVTGGGLLVNIANTGWYGLGGQFFAYASSTNFITCLGIGSCGNVATTSGAALYGTAIGYQALAAQNSSSANNVAIGYQSLVVNSSGSQNTGVGVQALPILTTGTYNTGIGYKPLTNVVDGANNVGIGALALQQTNGTGNVGLGYRAGYSLTGNANIILGQNVEAPVAGNNGQLNIGNVLYGTGLYNNSSTLSGTPLAGKIGIGTDTPYAPLSVSGQFVSAYVTATTTSTSTFGGPLTFGVANSTSTITGNLAFNLASSTATSTFAGLKLLTGGLTISTITGSAQCLHTDTNGNITGTGSDCGAGGGVTSVGLALPTGFTITNSPVTTSGTLTGTLAAGYSIKELPTWTVGAAGADFTTIQGALNACGNLTGGTIYLVDSTYAQAGTGLLWKGSNCNIYGRDASTTITFTGATTYFKTNSAAGQYVHNGLHHLFLSGDGNASSVAIDASDMGHSVYDDIKIDNVGTAFKMNDTQNVTFYNTITHGDWTTITKIGIDASSTNAVNSNYFDDIFIGSSASGVIGVQLNNANGNMFNNIRPEPASISGASIGLNIFDNKLATNNGVFNNTFSNWYIELVATGVKGVGTVNPTGGQIRRNIFTNMTSEANTTDWSLSADFIAQNTFINNYNSNFGNPLTSLEGPVGIGTSTELVGISNTPYAYFGISASSSQSTNEVAVGNQANRLDFIINNSGLTGIGATTSPGSILSIQGVGNFVANATSSLYNGLKITAGGLTVAGIPSALAVTDSNGNFQPYGGAAACSSNNFVTTISATGGTTCGTSTISGVSLGGTLAALTATDASLTFSGSYTGAAARTVGLNLGNANTWTASSTWPNINLGWIVATSTATSSFAGTVSVGSTTPNQSSLFSVGTSTAIINVDKVSGKIGILGVNANQGKMSIGPGLNANVNPNVFMLIQDTSDARFGASVSDSGVFMKSSGGVYAYDYAAGVPKALILQEFSGTQQRVGVATATPWRTLSVTGTVAFSGLTANSTGNALCISSTTLDVENAGATACIASTQKAKHDITSISGSLVDEVMNLRPVQYALNGSNEQRYGFIAEEAAKVDPKLVEYAQTDTTVPGIDGKPVVVKKGDPLTFDYQRYAGLLTAFVQKQQHEIDALAGGTYRAARSAEENWQWAVMAALAFYCMYNEVDKRRKK